MQLVGQIQRLSTNRRLLVLIGASALSSFGDWLYLTALPLIVYQATQDEALVGLVAAARMLPFLLLSMPAGAIADRFDRRTILVVTETTRCVLMVAMTGLYLAGAPVLLILVFALIANAAGTFAMPAQAAWMPQLAYDDDELALANATSSTLDNAAGIAGPAVAGLLVVADGLGHAFALNGITFAMVVVLLRRMGRPSSRVVGHPTTRVRVHGNAPAGWIAIARLAHRRITLDAAISFAAGALGILPVLIAVQHLGAGQAFAAVLASAAGLGAVVGGVLAGVLSSRPPRRMTSLGTLVATSALIVLGVSSLPIVAVGAIISAVAALVMLDTMNVTILQHEMPRASLGRALGVLHTSTAAWLMLGAAVPPIVVSVAGVEAALLGTAGVVLALSGASLITWPTMRRRAGASLRPASA